LSYTHLVNLPPAEAAMMHILNQAEVKRQVQSGMFATAYSCDTEDIANYGLKTLYKQHADINPGFWDYRKKTSRKIPVIVLERLDQAKAS
jgi:hypothetical protein